MHIAPDESFVVGDGKNVGWNTEHESAGRNREEETQDQLRVVHELASAAERVVRPEIPLGGFYDHRSASPGNLWIEGGGIQMRENRIDTVVVSSKSGLSAVQAEIFIDCTGDADLAAWGGASLGEGFVAMKVKALCRPVTIEHTHTGERWFPQLFRHTDNSLLLYVSAGHDAHFAPLIRLRSDDCGRTWSEPVANVPRRVWNHSFDDGELFELDEVGVFDPNDSAYATFWGAWSFPGRVGGQPRRQFVRMHLPSVRPATLQSHISGYPIYPWRDIWNTLFGRDDMGAEEILLAGFYVTTGIALDDGRLLALGYGCDRHSEADRSNVWTLESRDRGRTWVETGIAASGDALAAHPNESTIVRLRDGRLYVVMRVDGPADIRKAALHHTWSDDDGRSWSRPAPMALVDDDHVPHSVWPILRVMADGTLVLVYGRPGKHVICDPTGTGTQWQGRLDLTAWEKETQMFMGVPEDRQIRRLLPGLRDFDSSDYLAMVPDGDDELIVVYDVQNYIEHWNARPVSALRMLRARLVVDG